MVSMVDDWSEAWGEAEDDDWSEPVVVGGCRPGTVRWLSPEMESAIVTCDGHGDALAVFEAACVEGADLDDIEATLIEEGPDAGAWLVGPEEDDRPDPFDLACERRHD